MAGKKSTLARGESMFHRTSCTVSSQGRFLLSWPRIIFTIAQNSPLGEQTVVYFFFSE